MPSALTGGFNVALPEEELLALAEFQDLCHPQYLERFPEWVQMRDTAEGQRKVRSRTTVYLPRRHGMDFLDYRVYLQKASYVNFTGRTVSDLVRQVFRRPPIQATPNQYDPDSLSQDSRSFDQLMHDVVEEVLKVNRYGVLLDMDDQETNSPTPYLTQYLAEDILSWSENKAGPTMIFLIERSGKVGTNMFKGDHEVSFRLLALDENGEYFQCSQSYEYWRQMKDLPAPSDRIYPEVRGMRLTSIPFFLYSVRRGTFKPPRPIMLDISDVNLGHYQASAALEMARHYVGSPVYTLNRGEGSTTTSEGEGDEDPITISPSYIWELGPNDKADILSFATGNDLLTLENSLTEKENHMRILGARMMIPMTNAPGQTQQGQQSESDSYDVTLMDVVDSISNTTEDLLNLVGEWTLAPQNSATYRLNRQFASKKLGPRELRAIDSALGQSLPVRAGYLMLQESGFLPPDMTEDEFTSSYEAYKAEEERSAIMNRTPVVGAVAPPRPRQKTLPPPKPVQEPEPPPPVKNVTPAKKPAATKSPPVRARSKAS